MSTPQDQVAASVTTSSEELLLWKEYQEKSVAHHDLLSLVNLASKEEPRQQVKSDVIIDNLRQRYRSQQYYTALGHSTLLCLNPLNGDGKVQSFLHRQKKEQKGGETSHSLTTKQAFVMLTPEEQGMLLSDPRDYLAVVDKSNAHPFSLATRVYWHMVREGQNQFVMMR